ncbi:MAG: TerC family protein, partial [Klebsiella sp.]|nr:TerC family protein [Klebsiella sp.]
LISIPIIVLGSKLVLAILNRFPSVVMLGGALIGWIAGSMMVTDVTIVHLFPNAPAALPLMGGTIGAALVLLEGLRRNRRRSTE